MNIERKEYVLDTIDRLGIASVKQLQSILKIGKYRNVCRVIEQLQCDYLNVERGKEKIVYLNKNGRDLIGSEKEIKKTVMFDHMLLANEAYIYYDCPTDWKREYPIQTEETTHSSFEIQVIGLKPATKKTIIPDAVFKRDGYVYLVEIDNLRKMQDNRKKIAKYKEMWADIKNHFGCQPKLCIFTKSKKRKKEFKQLCGNLPCEVVTFAEI